MQKGKQLRQLASPNTFESRAVEEAELRRAAKASLDRQTFENGTERLPLKLQTHLWSCLSTEPLSGQLCNRGDGRNAT